MHEQVPCDICMNRSRLKQLHLRVVMLLKNLSVVSYITFH